MNDLKGALQFKEDSKVIHYWICQCILILLGLINVYISYFCQVNSNRNIYLFTSLIVLIYLLNFFLSDGFNGGADSITHFHISKFSWVHNDLFMDQWGKPVFNILFSPIAQLGFKAIVITNIILIFFLSWLGYKIAQMLNLKHPHWVAWIYLLTPIVIGNSISSLTEPICSLFLVLFIYYGLKNKWIMASIILGFMPFARSEGFVIVLLAIIFFLFTSRIKYIPFLLIGTLTFNTIGYILTGLPLWIFESNPYIHTDITVYGSGPFYHFFMAAIPIFGFVFIILLAETVQWTFWLPKILKSKEWTLNNQLWFWIILGSFWGYFMAHTVLWWLGMWASLGLLRVMFVICIPMALLVVRYLEYLQEKRSYFISFSAQGVFWLHMVLLPFVIRLFPLEEIKIFPSKGTEEKIIDEFLIEFKKEESWLDRKLFTGHPYILFKLEKDPFNKDKSANLWDWESAVSGDLILWDGHFGPNEHGLTRNSLDSDSSFLFLWETRPDEPFYTLNQSEFCVRLYEKQ